MGFKYKMLWPLESISQAGQFLMCDDHLMRTTLTIDDELAESIERLRKRQKVSLRELINRLLREGMLAIETKPVTKPYEMRTFKTGGLNPGIDPTRLNQLLDELDVEEFEG